MPLMSTSQRPLRGTAKSSVFFVSVHLCTESVLPDPGRHSNQGNGIVDGSAIPASDLLTVINIPWFNQSS